MFFSLLKFSIFSPFLSISIPTSISKFPKSSISISIFQRCKFQYQYQNQYFETVVSKIKININMSKILTFQNFSKFCAMSAPKQHRWFWCTCGCVSDKESFCQCSMFCTFVHKKRKRIPLQLLLSGVVGFMTHLWDALIYEAITEVIIMFF